MSRWKRRVRIEGVEYESISDAALVYDEVPATIRHRCGSDRYPDYEFIDEGRLNEKTVLTKKPDMSRLENKQKDKKRRPHHRKWNDEIADEIIRLRDVEKKTFTEIAEMYGCNFATPHSVYHRRKLELSQQDSKTQSAKKVKKVSRLEELGISI